MTDFIPLDAANAHRQTYYGSTNPSSIEGTNYGLRLNRFGVYVEKTRGLTQDFSGQPHVGDGNVFQDGIIKKGVDRLKVLGHRLNGFWRSEDDLNEYRADGTKVLRWEKEVVASDIFSADELKELGIPATLSYLANGSPDAELYSDEGARPYAVIEAKMRAYADHRFKSLLSNEPVPGLPGSGKRWYGDELTNEVLPSEYDQCQWLMFNADVNTCYLMAAFNMMTSDVRCYIVKRDDQRILRLKRTVMKFHWRHVINEEEPSLEASEACEWYTRTREQLTGNFRKASDQEAELAVRLVKAKAKAKWAKDAADKLTVEAISAIGTDKGIDFGHDWGRISVRKGKTGKSSLVARSLNSKLILEEN